jgi:exodeoxyribonuclease-3
MKIATYNVNGVNGRLPRLLEWLAETRPDVACLQELKTDDTKFPARAVGDAGYGAIWHGQRAHHGVAILARGAKPREIRRGLPGAGDDHEARYLEGEFGGLVVASVYLPNGNPRPGPRFDYKLAWFDRLIEHARALLATKRDVVLAGDFNVVPTDADIYDPIAWREDAVTQPASRAAWSRPLGPGRIDAARALHPRETIYTYFVHRFAFRRNAGFRMDFVLLSPSLRSRLLASGVDTAHRGRERPSDHAAAWVVLRDEDGRTPDGV